MTYGIDTDRCVVWNSHGQHVAHGYSRREIFCMGSMRG